MVVPKFLGSAQRDLQHGQRPTANGGCPPGKHAPLPAAPVPPQPSPSPWRPATSGHSPPRRAARSAYAPPGPRPLTASIVAGRRIRTSGTSIALATSFPAKPVLGSGSRDVRVARHDNDYRDTSLTKPCGAGRRRSRARTDPHLPRVDRPPHLPWRSSATAPRCGSAHRGVSSRGSLPVILPTTRSLPSTGFTRCALTPSAPGQRHRDGIP